MSTNGTDPMTQYARLSERVENQGKDIVDLRSNMNTGFQSVHASLNTLSNEFRNNSKTQWPVIWSAAGVCTAALVAAGTFVYGTIGGRQDRVEASMVTVVERMVTQKEMDWRTARGQEDRKRTDDAIIDLRGSSVSRNEWSERNHARDNEIAEIRRRIDEIRQDVGSQYTTRDVLLSTQAEVKDLRNQLRALYQSGTRPVGSIP